MTRHPIRGTVAVLAAAALVATLATSALAADPEPAAKKRVVKCDGKIATKVGTPGPDTLVGTAKRDIIAGLGGNDTIYGLSGNDVLCGGPGHDRLFGGPGRDKLLGQGGRDKLRGGTARDRLLGGPHHDVLSGQGGPDLLLGGTGNDRLVGGPGIDTCYQNSGQGALLQCELPAPAPVLPAPPPPPTLISLDGLLAVAYSDVDGLDGYSTGDVLIARLRDANGDSQPSAGDVIEMGRYPTNLDATTFADWGSTSHAVTGPVSAFPDDVLLHSAAGVHRWWKPSGAPIESYLEESVGKAWFRDYAGNQLSDDFILVEASPSQPTILVPETSRATGVTDDPFIDVVMNWSAP